jgi:hypothetical protein
MIELYMLRKPDGALSLGGGIYASREKAEAELQKEFPPGHKIFPGYVVVHLRCEVLE